jgi:uncharacterized protein YbaR (Trm112 family)
MIAQDLLDILVCPVCKKPLVLKADGQSLKCGACFRAYPIRDNIPILLVDEAIAESPYCSLLPIPLRRRLECRFASKNDTSCQERDGTPCPTATLIRLLGADLTATSPIPKGLRS